MDPVHRGIPTPKLDRSPARGRGGGRAKNRYSALRRRQKTIFSAKTAPKTPSAPNHHLTKHPTVPILYT